MSLSPCSSLGRARSHLALGFLCGFVTLTQGGVPSLVNPHITVDFDERGLTQIHDRASSSTVAWKQDHFSVFVGDDTIDAAFLQPTLSEQSETRRVFTYEAGPWTVRAEYELQPEWRFVSKRLVVQGRREKPALVRRLELLRGTVATPQAQTQRVRDGLLLRFGEAGRAPENGLYLVLQNPFLQLKQKGADLSLAYVPDMNWQPGGDGFVSDRLCLGPTRLLGQSYPARMLPEWQWNATNSAVGTIDAGEVDALVQMVQQFLLWKPKQSQRIHVGWCLNDYQVDIATEAGRQEYKRIIDLAAAVGCRQLLFAPANGETSSLSENRDAWGWENLLWFTMGQKLRKDEWNPDATPLPASVQELVDYAQARHVQFLAYVYPSLPFLQKKEWTAWVPNGQPGGYLGADTGLRSFQDWLLDRLVSFQHRTGAGGFSFDHWWIAYDETTSSRYAQWAGCRRVLEELRRRLPDAVIDGRQQYHGFGVWTWLAGTYPHPLVTDEQPESFRAFPDLHWSRVSADRERRAAWYYRMECFVPPEIMPGYMTHQTPRNDAKGETVRTRYRARDWDYLGWKYSVISSLATAPFNHVINFLPSRDEAEYQAFGETDRQWLKGWLDWTDRNLDILRQVRPILGAPQFGRVDGTAAFGQERGFVFLFNPNTSVKTASVVLDASTGAKAGSAFIARQLYPEGEAGRTFAPTSSAFWHFGETLEVPVPPHGALVLECFAPPPSPPGWLMVLGAPGKAEWRNGTLALSGVRGEVGEQRTVRVVGQDFAAVQRVTVNGTPLPFQREGDAVVVKVRFAGAPFAACTPVALPENSFAGGTLRSTFSIPSRIKRQLEARQRAWPVAYTEEERLAPWLNSDRLIAFLQIAEPDDGMKVSLQIDGHEVALRPAYTSILRNNPKNTFVGWMADLTALSAEQAHEVVLQLPELRPGQCQGLFLDTVEAEFTEEIAPEK